MSPSAVACTPLVPGRAIHATIVTVPPTSPGTWAFLTPQLTTQNLNAIRHCILTITENNGCDDHPAVVHRIKGKGMALVPDATRVFQAGQRVTYDPVAKCIWLGQQPLAPPQRRSAESELLAALHARRVFFQVSIADEEDIASVNNKLDTICQCNSFSGVPSSSGTESDTTPFVSSPTTERTPPLHFCAIGFERLLCN